MNICISKKHILVTLIGLGLLSSHITYSVFDWLDAMRDKLVEPMLGKVVKPEEIKKTPEIKRSRRRHPVQHHVAAEQTNETTAAKTFAPLGFAVAEGLTQAYITENIKTPINRITADAGVKTGFAWFGRKISSRDIPIQLTKSVLTSSVMFAVHNLATFFLYPDWLKDRWWMKGIANDICTKIVMGLASNLFGISEDN